MVKPHLRMDKNRVPILSGNEIDEWGESFVRDFCPEAMREPTPLDVDRFVCEYLGLTQDFAWLSNDGRYLGMTVFNDTRRVIVYEPEHDTAEYRKAKAGTVIIDNALLEKNKENRYRFTMGHEGAHAIFHTEHFAYDPNQLCFLDDIPEPMVQCRVDSTATLRKKDRNLWTPNDRMEWQANKMASAMLMPRSMVHKLFYSLQPSVDEHSLSAMAILSVADAFNVSNEAAHYRLLDLGLIKCRTNVEILLDFADGF